MQVDVVGRLPKRDRRGCTPRAHTGLRVEAPDELVAKYPTRLIPVEQAEAAVTSDIAPKPPAQPIKPPRRRRSSKRGQTDG